MFPLQFDNFLEVRFGEYELHGKKFHGRKFQSDEKSRLQMKKCILPGSHKIFLKKFLSSILSSILCLNVQDNIISSMKDLHKFNYNSTSKQ